MSTSTKHCYKLSVKRATRRSRRQPQRRRRTTSPSIGSCSLSCRARRTTFKTMVQVESKCNNSSNLSQKLQALKNLIPSNNGEEDIVKPDQLFKDTADYIVLLRTRVLVLQKLIEYYGNNPENENAVLL